MLELSRFIKESKWEIASKKKWEIDLRTPNLQKEKKLSIGVEAWFFVVRGAPQNKFLYELTKWLGVNLPFVYDIRCLNG